MIKYERIPPPPFVLVTSASDGSRMMVGVRHIISVVDRGSCRYMTLRHGAGAFEAEIKETLEQIEEATYPTLVLTEQDAEAR